MVTHFGLQTGHVRRRDIGRVAHDAVEDQTRRQGRKAVAQVEGHVGPDGGRVALRHSQRLRRNVQRVDHRRFSLQGQGDGETAAPRAEVEQDGGRDSRFVDRLQGPFRQQLRLWPGHEHVAADPEGASKKLGRSEDVLERFAGFAAMQALLHRDGLFRSQFTPRIQIERQPVDPQHVADEEFRVQARRFHARVFQTGAAQLDGFKNGHWANLGSLDNDRKRRLLV